MNGPFFVVLNSSRPGLLLAMTLVEGGEALATFPTQKEAEQAADENLLGRTYGYNVFSLEDAL